LLAEFFITNFNRKYGRQCTLDARILSRLDQYSWPGNIRELQNTLEKAVILAKSDKLDPALFGATGLTNQPVLDNLRSWEEIERYYLEQTILRHHGNLTEVSKDLKLSRPAVYRKLKKYGL
jgi:DNA-binding NtrC family response regulator